MYAHLQGLWVEGPYRPGDALNLLVPALDTHPGPGGEPQLHCLLDGDPKNPALLVLHPDTLLSGARRGRGAVAGGLGWQRQLRHSRLCAYLVSP